MGALFSKMAVGLIGRLLMDKVTGNETVNLPDDSKGLIQSKTAWGIGVASLGGWAFSVVSGWLGVDVSDLQEIADILTVTAGSLYAIYGRIKASGPIG